MALEQEISPSPPISGDLQRAITKWMTTVRMACKELGASKLNCDLTFLIKQLNPLSAVGCELHLLANVRQYKGGKFSCMNWGQTYQQIKHTPEGLEKELELFLHDRLGELQDVCDEVNLRIKRQT
ncbi:MAG TPA: hypothetical protein VKK79_12120 [Candidatus Lokiarchaeia archaeon]|nr:hypothetical protein [Candidatus Lokiarchaeia archaeon]